MSPSQRPRVNAECRWTTQSGTSAAGATKTEVFYYHWPVPQRQRSFIIIGRCHKDRGLLLSLAGATKTEVFSYHWPVPQRQRSFLIIGRCHKDRGLFLSLAGATKTEVFYYHWPVPQRQRSFLIIGRCHKDRGLFLSLAGATKTEVFSYHWWELPQVSFLSRHVLSRQKYACRHKSFVSTNIVFVATNYLLFITIMFVATSLHLSRQRRVCRDRTRLLSRQKLYLWHLPPMRFSRYSRLHPSLFLVNTRGQRTLSFGAHLVRKPQ